MNAEKWKVIVIALTATAAVSLGEALLAKGMKQTPDGSWLVVLRASVMNSSVLAGTLLMMVYFGLYMWALKLADLSFVLPLTAMSYLTGALLAKYMLKEDVSAAKWVGSLVITLGVIIVGLGSDSKH